MRLALTLLLVACSGRSAELGLGEPLRVRNGTFVEGPLPAEATAAAITFVQLESNQVRIGQVGKAVIGRASTDAAAVGIALAEVGTGYWVAPLGPKDPTAGNEYTFDLDVSIGWDVPIGSAALELVAIDADGRAGARQARAVCVRPDLLDNSASCDPSLLPPETVVALEWDAEVDLDLQVLTPEGKRVDASHPSTIGHDPPFTAQELASPGVGIMDRDSNAGCRIDGIGREALVWQTAPAPGTYVVYANLTSACGHPAASFTAVVYRRETVDGASRLVEVIRQPGRLLAPAANGGAGPGLFLLQLEL